MLRIKVPGGILTAAAAPRHRRAVHQVRSRLRRALDPPERPAALAADPRSAGNLRHAGQRRADLPRRLRRRRPQHHRLPGGRPRRRELFDCRPRWTRWSVLHQPIASTWTCRASTRSRIATCADQCNAPEINCIVFIGTPARTVATARLRVRVGGGLSSTPRMARDLGVFVPQDEALEVARAILDVWRTRSEVPGLPSQGALEVPGGRLRRRGRAQRRSRSGWAASSKTLAAPDPAGGGSTTWACTPRSRPARYYIGFPVFLGQITGEQTDRRSPIWRRSSAATSGSPVSRTSS